MSALAIHLNDIIGYFALDDIVGYLALDDIIGYLVLDLPLT